MIDEYLIDNRLYLKDSVQVECSEYYEDLSVWSGNHFWVTVRDFIDIHFIDRHQFILLIDDETKNSKNLKSDKLIYWCDVYIFLELHCYKRSEVRNKKLIDIGI